MIDIFDIETDGLKPTKIHCLSVMKKGKLFSTTDYDKMRAFFKGAKALAGHNIYRYDVPVVEKLLNIKVEAKLIDTLALSWYLEPYRLRHGLAGWGDEFGVPKPEVDDWENLSVEEYIHRCEEDVKINSRLWERQWEHLLRLYEDEESAWKLVDYLMFKMDCAAKQEKHRWKLDVSRCERVSSELVSAKEDKIRELKESMPKVAVMATKEKPKKLFLKSKPNTLSVAGESWFTLLKEQGLPDDYEGVVEYVKDWKDPNPGSHEQIKKWLYDLGWKPQTFKHQRNKETGEVKKIEQVQQDKSLGPGLCDSVKKLYKKEPKLEVLDGLSILTHRISVLNGFLNNVDDEGYVQAKVQGLTNTLRFKHEVVVNLPGVDKLYGSDIRGCLVAPEGYELAGSDMSSLESRTGMHYQYMLDPDYVLKMSEDGYDPHLEMAIVAKLITKEESEFYKTYSEDGPVHPKFSGLSEEDRVALYKRVKKARQMGKVTNYSATYGAVGATIARSASVSVALGETLHKAYWELNWSIPAYVKDLDIKIVSGQKWLKNPVSGLWYSLRHDKDRWSTLNQGTGVYCFDTYLKHMMDGGPPIIGQFHDEWIALVRKGQRDRVVKHAERAIKGTNEELKLNRELGMDIQFGDNYAEIH